MSVVSVFRCKPHLANALVAATLWSAAASPAHSQDPPATVTRSGSQILVSGRFDPAVVQAVQREIGAANGDVIDTLVVESTGGDSASAMALGRLVRSQGMIVRVRQVCAAACAAFLAPAASRLVIPEGSFLIFSPILSPQTRAQDLLPADRRNDPAQVAALSQRLSEFLDEQNAYLRELGVDPAMLYATVQAVGLMQAAMAAGGRTEAPLLVPSSSYLRECLGIASVDMQEFSVSDTETLTRIGRIPLAFLIDEQLYYDGATLAPFRPPCMD